MNHALYDFADNIVCGKLMILTLTFRYFLICLIANFSMNSKYFYIFATSAIFRKFRVKTLEVDCSNLTLLLCCIFLAPNSVSGPSAKSHHLAGARGARFFKLFAPYNFVRIPDSPFGLEFRLVSDETGKFGDNKNLMDHNLLLYFSSNVRKTPSKFVSVFENLIN